MRLLELHRSLLSDQASQEAYRKALSQTIRGGEAVLDLGTGTGVHAVFAARAGARVVYAVDQLQFVEVARKVCEVNGCLDRVRFFHGAAEEIELPEKVDVIVAHHGLPVLLELLPAARERFLKPGGTIIPYATEMFCAPLQSEAARNQAIAFWEQPRYDMNFSPLRAYAVNDMLEWTIDPQELLGEAAALGVMNFSNLHNAAFSGKAATIIRRPGVLHGLGMWFVQRLVADITISTAPPCSLPTRLWSNDFLPLEEALPVEPGEQVNIELYTGSGGWGRTWKWQVEVLGARGKIRKRFSHAGFSGHLVTKEMLRKQSPEYQPSLTPRGQVVRFVLEACEGARPLRWIEEEVVKRFPGVFSTPGEAAGLVARVVSRYTR
ncbi:MAG: 50S ribosomal protein L11 methyltransferase [Terriglobales bacterium]